MRGFLVRNWFFQALILGVVLALACPGFFRFWTSRLDPRPMVGLALFLLAWGLPSRSLAREAARPWASLLAVAISYGLVPAGAWLAGALAPLADYRIGLLLIASAPCTLGSAVLWTRMGGGNEATALLTILLSTTTSWLITNGWLTVAASANIGTAESLRIMADLLVSLVVPVGLGQLCRASPPLVRLSERARPVLSIAAQLLILSIIIKAATQVGERIHEGSTNLEAATALWAAGMCAVLHLAALAAGLGSSKLLRFDRSRQVAIGFSCSQKSLPVALILFDGFFQKDFPLAVVPLFFYHVGQLILDTAVARWLQSGVRDQAGIIHPDPRGPALPPRIRDGDTGDTPMPPLR